MRELASNEFILTFEHCCIDAKNEDVAQIFGVNLTVLVFLRLGRPIDSISAHFIEPCRD